MKNKKDRSSGVAKSLLIVAIIATLFNQNFMLAGGSFTTIVSFGGFLVYLPAILSSFILGIIYLRRSVKGTDIGNDKQIITITILVHLLTAATLSYLLIFSKIIRYEISTAVVVLILNLIFVFLIGGGLYIQKKRKLN